MEATLWKNFQVEITNDGSPTLRLKGAHPLDQTKSAESMHHSGGAATETLYIYGEALSWLIANFPGAHLTICSVGLGLGYNEILSAILLLENPSKTSTLSSFEIDPELKRSLTNWIFDHTTRMENQKSKNEIYDSIFKSLVTKLNSPIEITTLKQFMQKQLQTGSWVFHDELKINTIPIDTRYNICLFDAFSQKTSEELWNEDFLKAFIEKCFDPDFSMLVTYACTGVLTRTLKSCGFSVIKKSGFQGKRDSTWAERKK